MRSPVVKVWRVCLGLALSVGLRASGQSSGSPAAHDGAGQGSIAGAWQHVGAVPSVHGVARARSGRLYAILSEFNDVRVYAPTWTRSETLEIRPPAGVARFTADAVVAQGSRIVILDRRHHLIGMLVDGATHVSAEPIAPGVGVRDVCLMNDLLVLYSPDSGGTITKVDLKTRRETSFATAEGPAPPAIVARMDEAHVICDVRRAQIIVVDDRRPQVRAFSVAGKKVWTAALSAYRPIGFRMLSVREVVTSVPDSGYHSPTGAFVGPEGNLYVQLQLVTKESLRAGDPVSYQTYILDPQTGRERSRVVGPDALFTGDEAMGVMLTGGAVRVQSLIRFKERGNHVR